MSCGSKDILKMHPVSCTNIHYDVTGLVNQGMFENIQQREYLKNGT